MGSRLCEANIYLAQARVSLAREDANKAQSLWKRAADLYSQIGDRSRLANVSISRARLSAAQGEWAAAARQIQPAIDLARAIGHPLADDLAAEQAVWLEQAQGSGDNEE